MNHCGIQIQQNGGFSSFGDVDSVVCPKPRRINRFNATVNEPVRPLRWQICYQQEGYESKYGPELIDITLAKSGGGYGASEQTCAQIASSPPFYCGSPPSRVSNPLIQDARFGDGKVSQVSPESVIPNPTSRILSSSPRKVGYLGPNFGNYGSKPAMRIEGFDCLDRDNRRNCSIPTLA